jgi:hypothetical protein
MSHGLRGVLGVRGRIEWTQNISDGANAEDTNQSSVDDHLSVWHRLAALGGDVGGGTLGDSSRRRSTTMMRPMGKRFIWWTLGAVAALGVLAGGCSFGGDASSVDVLLPPATVVADSEFVGCLECHDDLDAGRTGSDSDVLTFDHADHETASESVGCGSCHLLDTHVGMTTFGPGMDTCYECHGVTASAPLNCSSCHPLSVVPSPRSHLGDNWARAHGIPLLDSEIACTTCHSEEQFCDTCHGLEMPHVDGFVDTHVEASVDMGDEGCDTCHASDIGTAARSDCDTCHHPDGNVDDPWLTAHPDVVNAGPEGTCETCHSEADFCTACHGLEMPHPERWNETDHAISFFEDDTDGCSACHDTTGTDTVRTECDSCHHPGGDPDDPWIIAHPEAVKTGDATCFTCHAQTTCVQCHVDGVRDFEADRTRFLESWGISGS